MKEWVFEEAQGFSTQRKMALQGGGSGGVQGFPYNF